MIKYRHTIGLAALLSLAGCASMPTGPSVMALPGTGMSFDQFRQDDYLCQQYALAQVGGTPRQAGNDAQLGSAVTGAAIGAAAGAALGGGGGAAIGAGTGLAAGTVVGSGEAREAAYASQHYYDNAYVQCMYGKGHRVPVSGRFSYETAPAQAAPAVKIPLPPPGLPPSPPPPPPR